MDRSQSHQGLRHGWLVLTLVVWLTLPITAVAADYANALQGVTAYDVVYDVSTADPKMANIVFWAVKNSYETDEVAALPGNPRVAVVFHGPAVKLLSGNNALFKGAEWSEVQTFQETLRAMKKAGVNLEVCLYAVKVMGVDKATIIPEIDQVGNGFVSVVGYQMQGYAVVRVP